MKKVYFLGAALLSSLTSFSQMKTEVYSFSKPAISSPLLEMQKPSSPKKGSKQEKAQGDVIWSEDFSTGSLTTDNGTWTSVGDDDFWTIANAHPWAANGWPTNLNEDFLIFNSYSNVTETDFASTLISGSIVSPLIDLSSITNSPVLNFNTEGMYCCHIDELPFRISVSEDGGTTWSDTISFDFGIERNSPTNDIAEPVNFTLDFANFTSPLTGNSANTRIKLIWESVNADINGQYNTHYFWMIDDLKIVDKYAYDVEIQKLWLEDITTDFEHTDIPKKLAGTLNVKALVRNLGVNIPTNAQLIVTVKDTINGGNVIATETGGVLTDDFADEYDFITFKTNIDLGALDVNGYTVTAEISYVETDGNPNNNSLTRIFNITSSYLGQRIYDQFTYIGSASRGSTSKTVSEPIKVGNVMKIPQDLELNGLEVRIGNNTTYKTTVGEKLTVEVYEIDTTAASFQASFKNLDIARVFTIKSDMVSSSGVKTVLLNFDNSEDIVGPVSLAGNKFYLITVGHQGGTNKHFAYAYNGGDDDYSCRLYGDYGAEPGNNWFTLGDQIQTRMFFDFTAGIDEENTQSIKVGNIYPNPTTGETSINYNLVNASKVAVKVMDITGKVVYSENQSNKTSGEHTLNINAGAFNSGVYYVTISTDEAQVTKKLIRK
jgi:hypothetical protein